VEQFTPWNKTFPYTQNVQILPQNSRLVKQWHLFTILTHLAAASSSESASDVDKVHIIIIITIIIIYY